jgi:hypothetical protein
MQLDRRVLLNPGADEMGMVMVMRAVEDAVHWSPSIAIAYPSESSASLRDPLEYTTIGETVTNLALLLHVRAGAASDAELAVLTPDDTSVRSQFFQDQVIARLTSGLPTAIADLSFLADDPQEQTFAVTALQSAGLADDPLAYASWNTTANTVGTALAACAATLVGKHFGTFDRAKEATFLFERYVDDYGYRLLVRPELQLELTADGADVDELGDRAAEAESRMRAMLWPKAVKILDDEFRRDGWRAAELRFSLPWQRTFEVEIDAELAQ